MDWERLDRYFKRRKTRARTWTTTGKVGLGVMAAALLALAIWMIVTA